MRALLGLAVWMALSSSCAREAASKRPGTGMALDLDPGPLLPPSSIGEEFVWRQRVTATWAQNTETFNAALQMHSGTLTLVGLSPIGRPGFVVTLSDTGVTLENRSDRSLPFPPEYIIADVQRVYYPWLPPPAPGFTGRVEGAHADLLISEIYADGVLQTRVFRRTDHIDRGEVRIEYEDWEPDRSAPRSVVLTNSWFGYSLHIVTVDQQRLSAPGRASDESAR